VDAVLAFAERDHLEWSSTYSDIAYTFTHKSFATICILDYALISKTSGFSSTLTCSAQVGLGYDSDHVPLVMRWSVFRCPKKHASHQRRPQLKRLREPFVQNRFAALLESSLVEEPVRWESGALHVLEDVTQRISKQSILALSEIKEDDCRKNPPLRESISLEIAALDVAEGREERRAALKSLNKRNMEVLRSRAREQFLASAMTMPRLDKKKTCQGPRPLKVDGEFTHDAQAQEAAFRSLAVSHRLGRPR
jgi:hypothetical protein